SLDVLDRGVYQLSLGFPLPGAWRLVRQDARWRDLEARRPKAEVTIRQARRWHLEGAPRDATTSEVAALLRERAAGQRDVVIIDTLPPEGYAAGHIPGAINVPLSELDAAGAARVIGDDRDREVVVYCSGYG